jgi:hypothetical protein
MGELSNARHERFAQELAAGNSVFTTRARLEEVIHGTLKNPRNETFARKPRCCCPLRDQDTR